MNFNQARTELEFELELEIVIKVDFFRISGTS